MTTGAMDELKPFIDVAYQGDEEIIYYYDKGEPVKTIADVCQNIREKIMINYPTARGMGLWKEEQRIGYIIYENDAGKASLLISFGVNKKYRTPEMLKQVWESIQELCGNQFSCVLYSYNRRAIRWLERCGMKQLVENVTILTLCQQGDN